jgi:Fe-S oxidoreductase
MRLLLQEATVMTLSPQVAQATPELSEPVHRPLYRVEERGTPNRVERFLRAFEAILRHTNYRALLDLYARSRVKCTRCADVCPVYQVTRDPRDVPCYRSDLLLKVYQRYFTTSGWMGGMFGSNADLTEADIDEMMNSFYRCTACRRCSLECPMGIDHALITHLGRYVLCETRLAPRALQVSCREQLEGSTGNTSAVPLGALRGNLEFLEEEIQEGKGVAAKLPLDREDVEYVFFAPVSDYLMEADTLMGNALVLHASGEGENWTIGSQNYDAINYGLFYSDWILERNIKRVVAEVRRLRARAILVGECGHASRSAKQFVPIFGGPNPPPVINCMELALRKFREGKLRLKPRCIEGRVTYHDPCNLARSGWIVEQPRELLRHIAKDFVEMAPNGMRNYCCGGGGGTVSIDEMHDFRMQIGGKVKVDQIRASGADVVVAPCANCKKQLRELVDHHKLNVTIKGLHDLLYEAVEV